jgi:hypothetical protein
MGNSGAWRELIHESICYHSETDPDAPPAPADRFLKAAGANFGGIRPKRFSEVFFARKRLA